MHTIMNDYSQLTQKTSDFSEYFSYHTDIVYHGIQDELVQVNLGEKIATSVQTVCSLVSLLYSN